jgi:hypothetical protein
VWEKRKYEIKKWRERMAGAKHDKNVTKPNLHDISLGKEWREPKKTKKRDYAEFKLALV